MLPSKSRSLLDELESVSLRKNIDEEVETRANHIIKSAINLLAFINENYDSDAARELERSFELSIQNKNFDKFGRAIKKRQVAKSLKVVEGTNHEK